MANIRLEGLLNTPELLTPDRESIKTRPKAVNAWIAALPQADPSQYGRKLYDYLHAVNKLDMPKKERLHLLLALRNPVEQATVAFKRHFITDNIPLSPKNQALFELSVELNIEMSIAYKILIEQTWTQKLTILNKKQITELLYWAIHHLSEILLADYQVYTEPPENTWVDLHHLYVYAEEYELESIKISDNRTNASRQESTIGIRYKQIVLLGLISPYRLRQQVIEKVYLALETWNEYCIIKSIDDYTRQKHQILLRMNSDLTPGFYLSDRAYNRDYTRVLDTEALEHFLSEQLIHSANSNMGLAFTDIPPDTLKLLLITWSGNSKRSFARKPTDNILQISIGIKATHLFISTANREHHEFLEHDDEQSVETKSESDDKNEATKEISDIKLADTVDLSSTIKLNKGPRTELSLEDWNGNEVAQHIFAPTVVVAADAPDIWDPSYTVKSAGYDSNIRDWLDSKTAEKTVQQPKQKSYDNINESASGHCLISHLTYDKKPDNLQIGDVIGLRKVQANSETNVGIGIIRRLKNIGEKIDLGIQKLARVGRAIEVCQFHPLASRRKFNRALLLPAIKSMDQPVTILSNTQYSINDALILNQNGKQSLVKISKRLESTGIVFQYEFKFEKKLGFSNEATDTDESTIDVDPNWSLS